MQHERQKINDSWAPTFYSAFKGFEVVLNLLGHLWENHSQFPSIDDYNQWIQCHYLQSNFPLQSRIQFIPQQAHGSFEAKVFFEKAVMTRVQHWHDFFNNLTWILWPQLKWAIIQRYMVEQANNASSLLNRNHRQSFLAQWDECGFIIITAHPELVSHIFNHRWTELFFHEKNNLHLLDIFVFGHGLLEKGLMPYLGMTGKAIVIPVKDEYFSMTLKDKVSFSDEILAKFILSDACYLSPKALQPFPLLGLPGWFLNNEQADFFENKAYFRPKRSEFVESVALNKVLNKSLWGRWKWLFPDHWSP